MSPPASRPDAGAGRSMFDFHSLRWRLQLWHALILAVVIAALCFLVWRLAAQDRRDRIDLELASFERNFIRQFWNLDQRGGNDPPPSLEQIRRQFIELNEAGTPPLRMRALFDQAAAAGIYLCFWDNQGRILFKSPEAPADLPFPLKEPGDAQRGFRVGNHRMLIRSPRGLRGVVGKDVSDDVADLRRLAINIAVSGVGLWTIGLLGGWWLAGRAIRPISTISATASRIAGGKVSERIDIADTDNELGRLSQVLNDTFDRLESAIARQRQFTADASHELRTPLTVILSETNRALKRDREPAEYREILSTCKDAAARMRSLVESLLTLARQEGEANPASHHPLDLSSVVKDAILLLQPLADDRLLSIRPQLETIRVTGDAQALSMVPINLLSNAINHQPPGGEISVRLFAGNGGAILEVADQGPGIGKSHLPRLFDRFYRVDPARGPSGGHSGLGLSIVKAVVENHQGAVEVESEVGRGTTFRVILPSS